MSFHETSLPGIGVRRELDLADGRRIGVVTHRDGQTELTLLRRRGSGHLRGLPPLTLEEASALSALLSGPAWSPSSRRSTRTCPASPPAN